MHRGARAPPPRSIAAFFGGGLAGRSAAPPPPPPRAPEAPPPRGEGDAAAADADAALPLRADLEGECGADAALEGWFAAAAPPAADPRAGSPPPLRVFSRKRRASAPPDGAAPPPPADGGPDAPAAVPATPAEAPAGAGPGTAAAGAGRRPAAPAPKYKQLYLDLGQANFGHATCSECGMMYARGEPGDEAAHAAFHAAAGAGIRFRGWQRERVTWRGEAGARCVHVAPSDPPAHVAMAARVAEHVTQELGLPPGWLFGAWGDGANAPSAHKAAPGRVHALLLVSAAGRVDGACYAERLGAARRVRPAAEGLPGGVIRASRHREAAAAGVRAVWVAPAARRRGAASALLDAARAALGAAGAPPPPALLAFSQPTQAGRALAARYAGTDAFLVYDDADVGQHPDPPARSDAASDVDEDGDGAPETHAAP